MDKEVQQQEEQGKDALAFLDDPNLELVTLDNDDDKQEKGEQAEDKQPDTDADPKPDAEAVETKPDGQTHQEDADKPEQPKPHQVDKAVQKLQQKMSSLDMNLPKMIKDAVSEAIGDLKQTFQTGTAQEKAEAQDSVQRLLAMTDEQIDDEAVDPVAALTAKATRDNLRRQIEQQTAADMDKRKSEWKQRVESIPFTGNEPALEEVREAITTEFGDGVYTPAAQAAWARTKKVLLRMGPSVTKEAVDGIFDDFLRDEASAIAKRRQSQTTTEQPPSGQKPAKATASARLIETGASSAKSLSSKATTPRNEAEFIDKWYGGNHPDLVTYDVD